MDAVNASSLEELDARCEPGLFEAIDVASRRDSDGGATRVHFERCGYFVFDATATSLTMDSSGVPLPVFNRTVTLSGELAKQQQPQKAKSGSRGEARRSTRAQERKERANDVAAPLPDEAARLLRDWAAVLATAPPQSMGKPSPEQIKRLKAHKEQKNLFLSRIPPEHAKWLQRQPSKKMNEAVSSGIELVHATNCA